jgi:hypothetical protein
MWSFTDFIDVSHGGAPGGPVAENVIPLPVRRSWAGRASGLIAE